MRVYVTHVALPHIEQMTRCGKLVEGHIVTVAAGEATCVKCEERGSSCTDEGGVVHRLSIFGMSTMTQHHPQRSLCNKRLPRRRRHDEDITCIACLAQP